MPGAPLPPWINGGQSNAPITRPSRIIPGNIFQAARSPERADQSMDEATKNDILQFPTDPGKYIFRMTVHEYSRESLNAVGQLKQTKQTILLPLPGDLTDFNQVSFEPTNIGAFVGAPIEMIAKGISGPKTPDIATESIGQRLGDAGKKVMEALGAVGGVTLGSLQQVGGPLGSAVDAGTALTGYSPNQFLTILMRGPQYKRHKFRWHLQPKNFQESQIINKMLIDLKNHSAPGLLPGGAIFSWPMIFQCAFMPNSQYLFKFKPAVMESIVVDYAGGGMPAFYAGATDNAPESVKVEMSFLELEFWLTGDYKNNNDPLDIRVPR